MRLHMGYPSAKNELDILAGENISYDDVEFEDRVSQEEVVSLQNAARQVFVENSVLEYLLDIVTATRTESEFKAGVSVRGGLGLKNAAQARAMIYGRDFVMPEDVQEIAVSVLSHRLNLRRSTSDPIEERRTIEGILTRIIGSIPVPR